MGTIDGGPAHLVVQAGRDGTPANTTYLNGTASQLVKAGPGVLKGFVVNSHTSGTLKFWDNTAGSGTVLLNTITFAAGPGFYSLPDTGVGFNTGLFVTVGGTIDYTILYQ